MKPDRWERIRTVFLHAADLAPEERAGWLARECASDTALRDEVERMLEAHERESGILDRPLVAPPHDPGDGPDLPDAVGPYRVVRTLGRGGMGHVYLAERTAAGAIQRVALKVVRRGMDTDDLLERFRTERRILARLDHPHIARLYDVGVADDGRPYFVMEFVDGEPLLEYCDERRLTLASRLRLFVALCAAVDHAHRSLVVHRDIKPQNVLVRSDGVPKLLDFGIAKLLEDDVGTPVTRTQLRLLTPDYGAPEQIRGDAVSTACDIYALGVLLYELVAGMHPFAATPPGSSERRRAVLETDPPRPSEAVARRPSDAVARRPSQAVASQRSEAVGSQRTRITRAVPSEAAASQRTRLAGAVPSDPGRDGIAAARGTTAGHLVRALAGDIDTIVLHALRKDPNERYPSALALAEDVERHLAGYPVRARPPSLVYRARKFTARNRVAVAAGAALAVVLTLAGATTLHQSHRIRAEGERAARERDKALQVRSFLLEMFGTTGPDQPTGDVVTVRQMLDRQASSLDAAFARDPEMRGELLEVLAEGYERLGVLDRAEELARRALAERQRLEFGNPADAVHALTLLGWILRERGHLDEAEEHLSHAVSIGRTEFGPGGDPRLARALNDLGAVYDGLGDLDRAVDLYRESLEMRRRLLGDDHIGVAITTSNLAAAHYRAGRHDDAAREGAAALERLRRSVGDDHQRTLIAQSNLATFRSAAGDHEGAADEHRRILEGRRRLLGAGHPSVASSLVLLANSLVFAGRRAEAEPLLDEALSILRGVPGARPEDLASALRVRGGVRADLGRPAEAVRDYLEALDILRASTGEEVPEAFILLGRAARAYEALGSMDEAERAHRRAVELADRLMGDTHGWTWETRLAFAAFLRRQGQQGQLEEADSVLESLERAFDAARVDSDAPIRVRVREVRGLGGGG